jgi:hypothetical protein
MTIGGGWFLILFIERPPWPVKGTARTHAMRNIVTRLLTAVLLLAAALPASAQPLAGKGG